jgi:hypothetical protein
MEGWKAARKEGMREGRKEGRKERKEGRKDVKEGKGGTKVEGKKEGLVVMEAVVAVKERPVAASSAFA